MSQIPATQKKLSMANFLSVPKTNQYLDQTLGSKKQEFTANLIAITENDTLLADCDPARLMKCAISATALNLSLNKQLGYAYIIGYKNKAGEVIPTFIIGYKGYIQLALRSGEYKHLNAVEVREGEMKRNKFTGELTFIGENPNGKVIGYVAFLKQMNGFEASFYMTESEVEAYDMKYSKAYAADKRYNTSKSLWSDPEERMKMALKTCLRQLLTTYGLFSIEIQKAMANDYTGEEEPYTGGQRTVEDAEIITQGEPEPAVTKMQAETQGPSKQFTL